jgi:uncharacterized membrane protein
MCMMNSMCHSGHGTRTTPTTAGPRGSGLEEVKRRYALGEITREQFEELKRSLGASVGTSAKEEAPQAKGVMK